MVRTDKILRKKKSRNKLETNLWHRRGDLVLLLVVRVELFQLDSRQVAEARQLRLLVMVVLVLLLKLDVSQEGQLPVGPWRLGHQRGHGSHLVRVGTNIWS